MNKEVTEQLTVKIFQNQISSKTFGSDRVVRKNKGRRQMQRPAQALHKDAPEPRNVSIPHSKQFSITRDNIVEKC